MCALPAQARSHATGRHERGSDQAMSYVRYVKDSLHNFVTGLGQWGVDRNKAVEFTLWLLDRATLENMYRGDWLARAIVDAPAEDITREWRAWQGGQQPNQGQHNNA